MVLKYNYVPEDKLDNKEERKWIPLEDGMCQFEIVNVIELDDNKDRIEFLLTDQRGNKGFKKDTFSEKTLFKVVALLKALGRMDLYTKMGELDFKELIRLKGYCTIKTKFYQDKNKDYQNIDSYIEKNAYHDEPFSHKSANTESSYKPPSDSAWDEDDIPF